MMIEKESELKVLRNFYDHLFDYFSIIEINQKTGLSRNWIYQIINRWEKFGILDKSGKKYKLNFANLFCQKLKLLFDAEYLNGLEPKLKNHILNMANKIIFEIKPQSLILVGSTALGRQKKESDLDFLAIGSNKAIPQLENCNIIVLDETEFKERYAKGDDFILSALLFGKIIFDNNIFINFLKSHLPIFSEELVQEKIKYCEKLKERIYTLLKTDEKKAKEELIYLALQTARIILLKNKIIPKTKYDLAEQIYHFEKNLSKIIKELLQKEKINKEKILDDMKICSGLV